jgi:hypothetical protein
MLECPALEEPIRCVVVDVSLGGLQVRSKLAAPVGLQCTLHIAQLGGKPLRVKGEVRHVAEVPGMDLISSGFRFLPETQEERVAIMEYVHGVFLRRSELMAG